MTTYYVVFDNDAPLFVALTEERAKKLVEYYNMTHRPPGTFFSELRPFPHYFHIHEVDGDPQ